MAVDTIIGGDAFLNGSPKLLGKIKKIELPAIKFIKEDTPSIGTRGTPKVITGYEAIQMKISWTSFYPDVLSDRISVGDALDLVVNSRLETWENGRRMAARQVNLSAQLSPSEISLGELEANKMITGMDDTYDVEKLLVVVDGTTEWDINVATNKFERRGKPIFPV